MGSKAARIDRGTIPALIDALKDPVEDVRASAAAALKEMAVEATEAADALVDALGDPSTRSSAAIAFIEMGPRALPAIAGGLKGPKLAVRRSSALVLAHLSHSRPASVLELLIEALKDSWR